MSITLFIVIMSTIPDTTFINHKSFYSQVLLGKKVFILGSSHVYALNTTIIQNTIAQHGLEYTVYNLGQGSDDPEARLRTIDYIISQKPDIVIYGIGFRDFESSGRSTLEKPNTVLPEPPRLSEVITPLEERLDLSILKNPKFAMIRTINDLTRSPDKILAEDNLPRVYPNTPFFPYYVKATISADPSYLERTETIDKLGEILPYEKNLNVKAFKQILKKLEENNIKTIVFTTPHTKSWLAHQSDHQKQTFYSILEHISSEFDFHIYYLHNKHTEMDIWENHNHLVVSQKTNFYSEEIASMIVESEL